MIRVSITQEHIDEGWMGDCTRCPIALALKDMGHENAWVDDDWIGLDGKESKERFPFPRSADLFRDDFDNNLKADLKPFSFVLVKKILPLAIDLAIEPWGSSR